MALFFQDRSQSDNLVELVELGPLASPFNLILFCLSCFFAHRAIKALLMLGIVLGAGVRLSVLCFPQKRRSTLSGSSRGIVEMVLVWVGNGPDQ